MRAAIQTWLTPPAVAGINTVYRNIPKEIPGGAFFANVVGATSGCVACLHIPGEREERKAMGGATSGKKRIDYVLEIQLFYRNISVAGIGDDVGLVAGDEFDSIIEALKVRIRSDRTAGGGVWQWGEADLHVDTGELNVSGLGGVECWGAVTTEVTEWITS